MLQLAPRLRAGDLVFLHDPQTAGMIPALRRMNLKIVWRCHIGSDLHVPEVERGWAFLRPYLGGADRHVFSRMSYVPPYIDKARVQIVTPTVDPTSSKNVDIPPENVRAILVHAGIIEGPMHPGVPAYLRDDGTSARVERSADIIRLGRAPRQDTPLVTQVSRWDAMKDPLGVMEGFAQLFDPIPPGGAELVLAGPNVHAVADDPEGAEVFEQLSAHWRQLPHQVRSRIHLLNLPMADIEENAAMVNALQRHSAVVVQKSLVEGFGLTVAEAMWKGRPVVASAVGGIQDQIEDGKSGLLLNDPTDIATFSALLETLLSDPDLAARLGRNAKERVRDHFLGLHSLLKYERLVASLLSDRAAEAFDAAHF
jgi:trehalose synthase